MASEVAFSFQMNIRAICNVAGILLALLSALMLLPMGVSLYFDNPR